MPHEQAHFPMAHTVQSITTESVRVWMVQEKVRRMRPSPFNKSSGSSKEQGGGDKPPAPAPMPALSEESSEVTCLLRALSWPCMLACVTSITCLLAAGIEVKPLGLLGKRGMLLPKCIVWDNPAKLLASALQPHQPDLRRLRERVNGVMLQMRSALHAF